MKSNPFCLFTITGVKHCRASVGKVRWLALHTLGVVTVMCVSACARAAHSCMCVMFLVQLSYPYKNCIFDCLSWITGLSCHYLEVTRNKFQIELALHSTLQTVLLGYINSWNNYNCNQICVLFMTLNYLCAVDLKYFTLISVVSFDRIF